MADTHPEFEAGLQRVLLTLQPYLADIVLIGGWVPYLYKRYGGHGDWSANVSFTRELDVLVPSRLPPAKRPPVADLLRAAGLEPKDARDPSAVWAIHDPGDEIEFFVPLSRHLRRGVGTATVPGQPGLAAIELPDLEVLARFSKMLRLPLLIEPPHGVQLDAIDVRVPRLGAYLLNKAVTFLQRQPAHGEATNPKRAKDLLYLRDLAAAGPTTARAIEADLADMIRDAPTLQSTMDRAASNLEWAMQSDLEIEPVAHMLVEREPERSLGAARQDVRGFLTDVHEVVSTHRSPVPERGQDDDG